MNDIYCQQCTPEQRRSKDYKGCYTCGGYGILYVVAKCPGCGTKYYDRMGAFTIYEGKQFRSMDGLVLTYGMKNGMCVVVKCSKCGEVHK